MKSKISDIKFLPDPRVPKGQIWVGNSVEIVETWNKSGEIKDVQLRKPDGTLIRPKFLKEYKEQLANFGKVFTFFED